MPIYSSDSDDPHPSHSAPTRRFLAHNNRPMHAILGGGKGNIHLIFLQKSKKRDKFTAFR